MNKKLVGSIISFVAVIAVVGVLVAGQHNNTSDDDPKNSADTTADGSAMNNDPVSPYGNSSQNAADPESPSSQVPTTNKITIDTMAFGPSTIKVSKGTTVTWTNKDSVPHNVTGNDGKGPHSQPLNNGDSYSYTFNEVGTFDYICTFHSNMKGEVVVE